MDRKKISLIVPCYNESEALPFFFAETDRVMSAMTEYDFEEIYVDDGSSDGTLSLLRERAASDPSARYVSFSRNFGKESAMLAGLRAATGDYVAILDADLQDPPSMLPEMLRIINEKGVDSVATRRVTRKGEPPIRSFFAKCFYKIVNRISKVKLVPGARDFRLMTRRMADAVLSLCEYNRFSKGIFEWVGCRREDKMVVLGAVQIFRGMHTRLFHRAACDKLVCRIFDVYRFDRRRACHNHPQDNRYPLRRFRLGIARLHNTFCLRDTAALYRYTRSVSFENLSGNEAPAVIYNFRNRKNGG